MRFKAILFFVLITGLCFAAPKKGVEIAVELSPAGGFTATSSRILGGKIINSGGVFKAKKLTVPSRSIKTGIELRDSHLQKRIGKSVDATSIFNTNT